MENNEIFRKNTVSTLLHQIIPYFFILFLLVPSTIRSANFGTDTAEYLKINPEAGPAGMGEAYTAIAEGTNALQYNPAGLAIMDKGELTATELFWFNSIYMTHLAFGYPLDYGFGVGGSLLWISSGSFDSTGGAAAPVSMEDGVINIGVGKSIGENIHLGLSLHGLYEHFSAGPSLSVSSMGFSTDAGAVFYLGSRNLTLGLTAKNMGILFGNLDPLPMEAAIGLGYRLYNGSFDFLNVALDFSKVINTDNFFAALGAEVYVFQAVALRFGLRYNNALGMDRVSFSNIQNMLIFSAGAGININDTFTVDYSYTPMGDLGQIQRITLKIKFGDSWYERKMAEKNVKIEPKAIEIPEVNVAGGEIKNVSFKPNVPQENVKEWTLAIKTSDGKIVKSFSGVGEVPKTLNWDGTDAYGRISKSDVNYVFDFKAKNDAGQTIKTIGQIVQAKQFDYMHEEDKKFTPLKGGEMLVAPVTLLVSSDAEERKSVPFVMVNKDIKQVKNWDFAIYDGNGALLKKFSGGDMIPSYLVWDGKDSYGNYVKDLKSCKYVLDLTGVDGKKAEIKDRQVMRDPFVISVGSRKLKMAQRIYFENNLYAINPQMMPRLDSIAADISGYSNVQIYIQGHSSSEGDTAYNIKLSQDRAKSVLRYLVEKHRISPLSITTVGYGANIPIDKGTTEDAKMRNRRVEIIIIGEKE
jgi:outer membrane protein OmpA-like peptidoglycan-associated protein